MQFSDLPNQGHNLRLYTYDPIGSQFGPKNSCGSETINTWIYNTGHYDIALGTPCSQPDPQGFCDPSTMNAYAAQRGEMLVMVSRSDLTALCGYRASSLSVTGPRQTIVGATTGAGPGAGGVTAVTVLTGGGGNPAIPGYIPPPGTDITDGGLPGGVGTSGNAVSNAGLLGLYRFILFNPSKTDPGNPYSTGANYPGCSQLNTANCDGRNFPTEAAAIVYAESHGETPYRILSAGEVWGLINGTIAIDPSRLLGRSVQGIGLGTVGLLAAALWFLSGR